MWCNEYKIFITQDIEISLKTPIMGLFGGMSAGCFFLPWVTIPFDVVKTRMQGTKASQY
jgi:solute carrier family 25 (mitochondrial citrate transporter), member 1